MKLSIFNKKTILAIFSALILTTVACKSTLPEIDKTMTSQELIQRGQDSAQNGKPKEAMLYYQSVIDLYGDDLATYVEAKYEIGHLYMKSKNYKVAQPVFEEILEIFRNSLPGTLPASYNKLSEIELAKIPQTKQALAVQASKEAEAAAKKSTIEADEY